MSWYAQLLVCGSLLINFVGANIIARNTQTEEESSFYDLLDVTKEEEELYGFKRPEFQEFKQNVVIEIGQENQSNAHQKSNVSEAEGARLPEYDKHIFILTRARSTTWDKDILRKGFAGALTNTLNKMKKEGLKCKVSIAEATPEEQITAEIGSYDLIVMPDSVKYIAVKESELDTFTSIISGKSKNILNIKNITEPQIFVCCHIQRHPSIKACGPRIFKALVETSKQKNISVIIRRVTDLGGFKHETNLIMWNWQTIERTRKSIGDWYWNIGLNDIDKLLSTLKTNKIIIDRWRGRCGMKASTVHNFLKFQIINNQQ
jgi:hypothetical protein